MLDRGCDAREGYNETAPPAIVEVPSLKMKYAKRNLKQFLSFFMLFSVRTVLETVWGRWCLFVRVRAQTHFRAIAG